MVIVGHSNDLLKSRFKRGRCGLCGKTVYRLEFHHIKYRPEITMPLCHGCHFKIHFRPQLLSEMDLNKILCRVCKPQTMIKYQGKLKELFNLTLSLSHSLSHYKKQPKREEEPKHEIKKAMHEIAPSRQDFTGALKLFKERENQTKKETA